MESVENSEAKDDSRARGEEDEEDEEELFQVAPNMEAGGSYPHATSDQEQEEERQEDERLEEQSEEETEERDEKRRTQEELEEMLEREEESKRKSEQESEEDGGKESENVNKEEVKRSCKDERKMREKHVEKRRRIQQCHCQKLVSLLVSNQYLHVEEQPKTFRAFEASPSGMRLFQRENVETSSPAPRHIACSVHVVFLTYPS